MEIAERMGIAERTVKGYAWHVGTKLNVDDTRHLNVQIATKIHDIRAELGIKCQACGEM